MNSKQAPSPPSGSVYRRRLGFLFLLLGGAFGAGMIAGGVLVGVGGRFFPHPIQVPAATATPSWRNNPQALLAEGDGHALPPLPAPSNGVALTPDDLRFGELQVSRMVRDRPEMLRYVKPSDPVWRYCARAFGGAVTGAHIYWDSSAPPGGYLAQHQGAIGKDPGLIRVRKEYGSGGHQGEPVECEEAWASAVYELENIRGTAGFQAVWRDAVAGKLNREQFIRESTRLEYAAALRTERWYGTLWKNPQAPRGIPGNPSYWQAPVPKTYAAWISQYQDPTGYPWDCWGRSYDEDIASYREAAQPRGAVYVWPSR